MDDLLDWMKTHGAIWADGVEIRHDQTFGWAPFTTSPLDADVDVLTVPFDLVLTPQLGDAALAGLLGCDVQLGALEESARLAAYLVLHWMMAAEEGQQSKKLDWSRAPDLLKHAAYVRSLPTYSLSPVTYSPAEMALLKGTPLPSATSDLLASWEAQHRALSHATGLDEADGLTFARFKTAMGLIASRSFPSRLLDSRRHDDPLADLEPDATDSQTGLDHPILIPGLDLLNHRPLTPVSWVSTPATASVSFVHHFPLGPDQQIFNNYGSKPSTSLLLSYGFALPLDRQPEGTETLPLLLGGIPPAKQALCDRIKVPWSKALNLCLIDGVVEPPTALRRLLRAVVADADEEAAITADPALLDGRVSTDNELAALDTLAALLDTKLALLQSVASADPSDDVRADVVRVATVYRTNQILLLTEAAAWTARELRGVEYEAEGGVYEENETKEE